MKLLEKQELEEIALAKVLERAYAQGGISKVYEVNDLWVQEALSKIEKMRVAKSLNELERAMADPQVEEIFLPHNAAITSKGLQQVLARSMQAKIIYAAFGINWN